MLGRHLPFSAPRSRALTLVVGCLAVAACQLEASETPDDGTGGSNAAATAGTGGSTAGAGGSTAGGGSGGKGSGGSGLVTNGGNGAMGGTGGTGGAAPAGAGGAGAVSGVGGASAGASTGGTGGCPSGTSTCGDECKNLTIDVTNCGACGVACRADQSCVNGACACTLGQLECGGVCLDVSGDPANCGSCGTTCPSGQVCSQGQCSAGCAGSLTRCGGACIDTTGHQNNCGGCGNVCPADQMCAMSSCRCRTGQASCNGGACQDVLSDESNCGECGNACATGSTCTNGACTCPNGGIVCSGACVDPTTDAQNCGTCGTRCGSGTSCLFGGCIDPNSVNCGGGSQMSRSCTRDAYVLLGKYWVNNNQWGISGSSGQQCIWGTCQTGDLVGWGTDWQWSGGGNGVKTYVSLVFGWQWGWRVSNTGLPIQISSGKSVNCGWSFSVTNNGTINVSYDMWVHSTSNPDSSSDPTDEVMVWLYRAGGAGPIGTQQTTVTIGGSSFDLYRGMNGATNVFSYVRTQNATTAVHDMTDFLNDLVSRGWMQSNKYLASVQAGTEVYSGSGSLTTNGFYCRIQ